MRLLKVVGTLAVLGAVCTALLVAVAGPLNPSIPGFKYSTARQIGNEFGGWLFIFVVSTTAAGIVAFVSRKQRHIAYPGLKTGIALAFVMTALNMMGRLQLSP